ncbi:PAP_central domain-containing protein [Meloidogyne graminicola]|uniref:polynucleotide adenylyltransferase n=1 Tax=Meloidogyne graminicola TaxID=189291 RepID=A0A8S9Z874_9BILA|nr:PAP_central domain-containing protein [Meloidogyne graminicola]
MIYVKIQITNLSAMILHFIEAPIHQLNKNVYSRIKIMEFIAFNVQFDISFIILEEIEIKKYFPIKHLNNNEINLIIENQIKQLELLKKEEHLGNIKEKIKEKQSEMLTLASYQSNKIIKKIIETNDNLKNKFVFATKTIKLWAKNNYIYDNQFGFLNGSTINLIVLKLVLIYFDSSMLYLLEKDWRVPIKLKELTVKSQSWSLESEIKIKKELYLKKAINNEEIIRLEKHVNTIMGVLTPSYPEQNSSYNVNYSTLKIIRKEIKNGLKIFNDTKNKSGVNEEIKEAWKIWINGLNFLKKYKHYLLILCLSNENKSKESINYCRFVESRIRLELLFTIEQNQEQIKYIHSTNKEKCLPNKINEKYGEHYIQHWWIGIEINNNYINHLSFDNNEINNLNLFIDNIRKNTPFIFGN